MSFRQVTYLEYCAKLAYNEIILCCKVKNCSFLIKLALIMFRVNLFNIALIQYTRKLTLEKTRTTVTKKKFIF